MNAPRHPDLGPSDPALADPTNGPHDAGEWIAPLGEAGVVIPAQSRRTTSGLTPTQIDLGAGSDPSQPRGQRVRAQLEHLFPPTSFGVVLGYAPAPEGWREVETWRIVPRPSSPRFMLPVNPAAARATVLAHNGLRSARVAATRRLTAWSVGPLSTLRPDSGLLRLSVPQDVAPERVQAEVITQHLLSRLPEASCTAISLRDFHARAKPTVQLLDDAGRVVAFAKVASDPATAERVLIEADLLERLGAPVERPDSPIRLPRVIDVGRCGPFAFSVVAPLPQDVVRVHDHDELRVLRALKAFAESLGPIHRMPLAQTTLWDDVMGRVSSARAARGAQPELVAALDELVATAHRLDATLELPVGAYHGDWVPWNMAWSGTTLWVWDLEYGSPQGPFGLDALRWVFQTQHVSGGASFTEAIAAMQAATKRLLPILGIESHLGTAHVRLHVIDTVASALQLLASGRGMPEGLDGAHEVMRSLTQPDASSPR